MKRVITAAVGVPATILLTLYTPNWFFVLAIAATAALCIEELLVLGATRLDTRPGRWVLLLGAAVTASFAGGTSVALTALAIAILAVGAITAFSLSLEEALPKAALATMGILYCGLLLGFLLLMRRDMIIVLLGVLWVGDAAALYGGRLMGRHLLAPQISPRKTIEGAFAGLIGSIITGMVLGAWFEGEASMRLLVASLLSACAGQVGDLVESAIKRSAGVKDSSSLFPGHGGLLDRLDGLLFAAPVYYWILK
jgi:phosphatidate cytidylyltransferase